MHKVRKASWLILGLYCSTLAVGFIATSGVYTKDNSARIHHFSFEASNLLGLTISSDHLSKYSVRISESSKVNFADYLSSVKIAESGRAHMQTKYLTYSKDKLQRFESWDIVFPFHYFL